jgi:RecB family exonuclease
MRQVINIRASSLGDLFDCPARWAAKHIDGKSMPSNSKAVLGTAVHASTAMFDQAKLSGSVISVDEAAAAAIDAIYRPEEDVHWEDGSPDDIAPIAVALHNKYCRTIAPEQTYAGVEIKCEALEISDLGIALTGTTDRIYQTPGGLGIADVKTGKAAVGADGIVATKGHAFQLGVYELLAEHASGLSLTEPARIIGMNTAKTDAAQRMGIGEISGARDVLLGDDDNPGILHHASTLIHSGSFWGNPKSMLCHKNYCPIYGSCNFRK